MNSMACFPSINWVRGCLPLNPNPNNLFQELIQNINCFYNFVLRAFQKPTEVPIQI